MLELIGKISAIWLVHGSGIAFYKLMKSYHNSKPLGHQTLLGKVIASLFMNALIIMTAYHGIIYTIVICLRPRGEEKVLKIGAFFSCVTILLSEWSLLFVVTTKYLSIYHSTFIYGLNEAKAVRGLKIATVFLALTLTTTEYLFISPMEKSVMFQVMLESPNSKIAKVEKVKIVTFILIFVVSATLQIRLEFQKIKQLISKWFCRASATTESGSQCDQPDYKPKVLNIALTAFASVYLLAIYQTFVKPGNIIASLAFAFCIAYILLPLIFIYNHNNLKKYCSSKIVQSFNILRRK